MSGPDLVVVGKSPWPSPIASSGSFAYAAAIAEELGSNYHVIVPRSSTDESHREQVGRLTVHRVGSCRLLPFMLAGTRAARRLMRGRAGDIMLVSSDPPGGLVCEFARLRSGILHIFSVQGEIVAPGPEYGNIVRRRAIAIVVRLILRRATAVRSVSEPLARQSRRFTTRPVHVVGTRVDTTQFTPVGDPTATSGAAVVASLTPRKNIELVLRAWAVLPPSLQRKGLRIVGDGPAAASLRHLADGLGVRDTVTFTGRLTYAEVAETIRRSRVLLLMSFSEGHPRVVLEALACGVPVIVSDTHAHQELLTMGKSVATLVGVSDVEGCAAALSGLLGASTGQWVAISRLAREAATEHYDFADNVRDFGTMVRVVSQPGQS